MANVKITQLPLATTPLTGTEDIPLVQGTTTKQVTVTGLFTDPVMTNPRLGVVGQADLINATGLPISTGVAGLGTGVATFLGTPSSANLRTAVTDETGTGSLVFATSPTLVTPNLGTPTAMVATNITGTALGLIAGSAVTNANLTGAVTSVGNATSLGSFTSAQLATALTDETGSGANVFATSPTLVTPILGTPTSATLTNATGLPISTGVSGLGTGVATFLGTPSSANLLAAVTDETGTGSLVFATSPTLVTPILGTPTSGVATNLTGLPLTTGVTGTLPTANGGTNLTSFTSGGVVYASSTSALATGSALTYNGTGLGVGRSAATAPLDVVGTYKWSSNSGGTDIWQRFTGGTGLIYDGTTTATDLAWIRGGNEQMRLTSTGLGIGTSSPAQPFVVSNAGAQGIEFIPSSGTLQIFNRSTSAYGTANIYANTFYVRTGASPAINLTVDVNGNTGIGTSSPLAKLDVLKTSNDTVTRTNAVGAFGDFTSLGAGLLMQQTLSSPYGFTLQAANAANSVQFPLLLNPSGGSVGIGTSSPTLKLDVSFSSSGDGIRSVNTLSTGFADVRIGNNTSANLAYLRVGGSAQGGISQNALVIGTGGGYPIKIAPQDTVVATFEVNKSVALQGASTATGTGITFPATQSASSDANTLDDYEEGSWTPGFGTGWSIAPTVANAATYVKIGKQVTVSVYLLNGISTAGGLITGLPFQVGLESSMTGFSGTTSTAPLMTGVTQSGTSQIRSIPAATMTGLYWTVSTTYFV